MLRKVGVRLNVNPLSAPCLVGSLLKMSLKFMDGVAPILVACLLATVSGMVSADEGPQGE